MKRITMSCEMNWFEKHGVFLFDELFCQSWWTQLLTLFGKAIVASPKALTNLWPNGVKIFALSQDSRHLKTRHEFSVCWKFLPSRNASKTKIGLVPSIGSSQNFCSNEIEEWIFVLNHKTSKWSWQSTLMYFFHQP